MFNRPQFPIPETIHPAKNRCICIPVPDDPTYIQVFVGLVHQQTQWFNWFRDGEKNGKEVAQVWKEIFNNIDWSIMSCCCGDDNSVLHRYTPEGHYQKSNDGGTTWEDDPAGDPRNPQPYFPPNLPEGGENNMCQYADSVVKMIQTQLVDLLDGASTYQEILGIIVTVFTTLMGALAPTVIGSIIVGILGAVIVGIVSVSVPAFMAAMTTDVYNRFRCNLFCHMQADGSFTQADLDAIYAQIAVDETGMAMLFLQGFVAAAGTVGMTNASHLGFGDVAADCSACCPDCSTIWTLLPDESAYHGGTIISHIGNKIRVQSTNVGGSRQQVGLWTGNPSTGCCTGHYAIISGDYVDFVDYIPCGGDSFIFGYWNETSVHQLLAFTDTTGPFVIEFTFNP